MTAGLISRPVLPSPKTLAPAYAYVKFCLGGGISFMGSMAQRTAIGWLAWDTTHSVAWVGTLALADFISAFWVAPLAAWVSYRLKPSWVLGLAEVGSIMIALLLALCAATGHLGIYTLLLLVLLEASFRGIAQPVQMLMPGLLAGKAKISKAVATSAVSIALACAIGPAITGLLMHWTGQAAWVFVFNALTSLALLGVVYQFQAWMPGHKSGSQRKGFGHNLQLGMAFILRSGEVRKILIMTLLFSFLARPFSELLPAFAGHVFNGGAEMLASLMTAQGVGAVIGAIAMLRKYSPAMLARILFVASIGIALALLVFASQSNLAVLMLSLAMAGVCHVVCNIAMQSLCQLHSPRSLRARVMTIYALMFRTLPALGAFAASQIEAFLPLSGILGGMALIYLAMVIYLRYKP